MASQANIRKKNKGKNIIFAVHPSVTFCSGSVTQRAPLSMPAIERIDETILNQLKSTFIPNPFSTEYTCEPLKNMKEKRIYLKTFKE